MSKIHVIIALMAFSQMTLHAEVKEDFLIAIKASDNQQVKNLLNADISGLSLQDKQELYKAARVVFKQRKKTDLAFFQQGAWNVKKMAIGAGLMLVSYTGIALNLPQDPESPRPLLLVATTPAFYLAYVMPAVGVLHVEGELAWISKKGLALHASCIGACAGAYFFIKGLLTQNKEPLAEAAKEILDELIKTFAIKTSKN